MFPRSFSRSCSSAVITGSCFCLPSVARSSSSCSGDFTIPASAFGDPAGDNFFSVNLQKMSKNSPYSRLSLHYVHIGSKADNSITMKSPRSWRFRKFIFERKVKLCLVLYFPTAIIIPLSISNRGLKTTG